MENNCFVCSKTPAKTIIAKEVTVYCCTNCGTQWQWPLKEEKEYEDIYTEKYYKEIWGWRKEKDRQIGKSKFATSKNFIKHLHNHKKGGKVLDIGCGLGYLLSFLQQDNYEYDVYGVELSGFARNISEERMGKGRVFENLEELKKKRMQFDAILLFDSMEHIPNQDKLLKDIDVLLAPKGKVLVIMPAADSFAAKIMGKQWIEYKKDHVLFYTKKALKQQLEKYNFRIKYMRSCWKTVTLVYLASYLSVFRIPIMSTILEATIKLFPEFIQNIPISIPIGQMMVVFERKEYKNNNYCGQVFLS
ncbi:class I SAM-dependent methyltransferase [Candidatus Woesearchaeota archaeon]|nr:class I SAM-dependent methyltransferase [Candidatus Woesearchaeota archaeon]